MFRVCFGGKPLQRGSREPADALTIGSFVSGANGPGSGAGSAVAQTPQGEAATQEICQPVIQPSATTSQDTSSHRISGPVETPANQDVEQTSASSAPSTPQGRSRLAMNASRPRHMQAEEVMVCDAQSILEGLRLKTVELGRGSYGIVVPGNYQGVPCAVKVMLSRDLDRAAVRELLLGPGLVHPNITLTYATRCAQLTHEFFDYLEGGIRPGRSPDLPRVLGPMPINSEDGFGDPKGVEDGSDPTPVLHQLLHALGAETSMMLTLVIQELCNRGTLDNAIRKSIFKANPLWNSHLARRALLRTATEMARGLLHLHDTGVVHGDFKPANVLFNASREDRRGFTAKISDFGLSHVLPAAVNSISTDCMGSVAYMAPEAFQGKISRATDVWAFGVCLWEMLTGRRPYDGVPGTLAELARQIQEGRIRLKWPDNPEDAGVSALGRRCLAQLPADRPSFKQIVEELVGLERAVRAAAMEAKTRQARAVEARQQELEARAAREQQEREWLWEMIDVREREGEGAGGSSEGLTTAAAAAMDERLGMGMAGRSVDEAKDSSLVREVVML